MEMQSGVWRGLQLTRAVIRVSMRFMGTVLGLFAASAQTAPADDEMNSAIRGALLNYRTGKVDDGMDSGGIYKPD